VILCVGAPNSPSPRSKNASAQDRIDLLALDQNAWILAGRDPRCVVADSRTELDWGLRNGQTSVWAPSKLAANAPGCPGPADPVALALWFAALMGADDLRVIGPDSGETRIACPRKSAA
jgi:7,8-dihydroneopterin aldolase/epimerase/oxygenase